MFVEFPFLGLYDQEGAPQEGLTLEVVAEGLWFLGAPKHSGPWDGLSMHFPNPKIVGYLKTPTLEGKYLLLIGCEIVIPNADATINKAPWLYRNISGDLVVRYEVPSA